MHPEVISGGAISVAVPSPSSPSVSPPPHPYVSAYSEKKTFGRFARPLSPRIFRYRAGAILPINLSLARSPPGCATRQRGKSAALFLRVPPTPHPSPPLFLIYRDNISSSSVEST